MEVISLLSADLIALANTLASAFLELDQNQEIEKIIFLGIEISFLVVDLRTREELDANYP